MQINRHQIIKNVLENLYRISNKDYQQKIWIDGAGPECHDFDEAANDFFGDGEPILKNYQDYKLSSAQYLAVKKFHDHFRLFADENIFPNEFIDTPEWAEIMSLAKEVLNAFNYTKLDYQQIS